MKFRAILLASVAVLALSGCANVAATVSNLAASVASQTPNQVRTLGDAIQAADLVTKATDAAVNTGKIPPAILVQIGKLSDGLHAALTDLEAAQAAGKSLDFAAFNAALDAFNAYATSNAVPH